MGQILFKIFQWGVSSGLLKFVKGMGISLISFAVLNELIQRMLAMSATQFGTIAGLGATALGLSGFDTAFAIVAGAIITHVYMKSQATRFIAGAK